MSHTTAHEHGHRCSCGTVNCTAHAHAEHHADACGASCSALPTGESADHGTGSSPGDNADPDDSDGPSPQHAHGTGTCGCTAHGHNHAHGHTHPHDQADAPACCHDDCHDHCHSSGSSLDDIGKCSCGHDHGSENPTRERNVLIGSAVLYALALVFESRIEAAFGQIAVYALFFIPYAICGWSIYKTAFSLIRKLDILNEFTLMSGATLVAIALELPAEAAGVMLFYRIGEYFQEKAAAASRTSIRSLLASKPSTAHVERDGSYVTLPVEAVNAGDIFLVRAGESIPLDGEVISGSSFVDQSPLTGESVPVSVSAGSPVLGGSINKDGVITARAKSAFKDTHMARVLDMVESAAAHKAPTERFITRFARYYTPAVVFIAALVAILPPLLTGAAWETWIYRALVMLVISCPCALVISVPLSYFAGIGAASKKGILVKGGTVLDGLTHVDTVIFDKTGTLTRGVFEVNALIPAPGSVAESDLLAAAALAECESNHPIARSIMARAAADGAFVRPADLSAREHSGKGMSADANGMRYFAGSAVFMRENGFEPIVPDLHGTLVFVAEKPIAETGIPGPGRYLGCIAVSDAIKEDAAAAVAALNAAGMKTIMLTGDRPEAAAWVAKELGITEYRASLLPEDKVAALNELAASDRAAFVGDGINDAPILALSRVGIAMGGVGAEAAVEAADAVILNDAPSKVAELFRLAGRVRGIVWQNVALALGIKTVFMGLGVVGLSGLWEAVFADVGVALLAVLNASRASRE